jgi:hypothetical protein
MLGEFILGGTRCSKIGYTLRREAAGVYVSNEPWHAVRVRARAPGGDLQIVTLAPASAHAAPKSRALHRITRDFWGVSGTDLHWTYSQYVRILGVANTR